MCVHSRGACNETPANAWLGPCAGWARWLIGRVGRAGPSLCVGRAICDHGSLSEGLPAAQTFTVLYSFAGYPTDGGKPAAGLLWARLGACSAPRPSVEYNACLPAARAIPDAGLCLNSIRADPKLFCITSPARMGQIPSSDPDHGRKGRSLRHDHGRRAANALHGFRQLSRLWRRVQIKRGNCRPCCTASPGAGTGRFPRPV